MEESTLLEKEGVVLVTPVMALAYTARLTLKIVSVIRGVKLLKLDAFPHKPCTSTTGGLATTTLVFVVLPPVAAARKVTVRVVKELSAVPRAKFTGPR